MKLFIIALTGFSFVFGLRSAPKNLLGKRVTSMQLFAQLGRVTMYKKEGCPYCKKARELLEEKHGLKLTYVDIEDADVKKKEEILQQMRTFSGGRNTVPQIFFNAEHLGGNDDVQKLDVEGKLAPKVKMVMETEVSMMQEGWYHPWY